MKNFNMTKRFASTTATIILLITFSGCDFSYKNYMPNNNNYNNALFTIDLPKQKYGITEQSHVMFFLPPLSNGFSPNVNVVQQVFHGSLQEYLKNSRTQMTLYNFTEVRTNISGNKLIMEYFGLSEGFNLRFYVRAIKSKNSIFLITATATEEHWKEVSPELIQSVKSFRLK